MNAYDPDLFAASTGCLPCCNQPTECACALLIPPLASPYADYATAAAAIASDVYDCLAFAQYSNGPAAPISASYASNALTLDATIPGPGSGGRTEINWFASVTVAAGASIQLAITGSSDGDPGFDNQVTFSVYDCEGTQLDSQNANWDTSYSTSFAVPAGGVYIVNVEIKSRPASSNFTSSAIIDSSDGLLIVNPVIALWDDSGTTRQLEACPKFILPFPEWIGSWYADCASAESAMGAYTVDCLLFVDVDISTTGYSASLSDTDIDLEISTPDECVPQEFLNGTICVNLVGGESVSISGNTFCSYLVPEEEECPSCNPDFPDECDAFYINISVTAPDGTAVASDSSESPSLTQSASTSFTAPYSGKFYFSVSGGRGNSMFQACCLDSVHVTGSISASTISVNPIQALYDLGLDCPARLNCGDSCP